MKQILGKVKKKSSVQFQKPSMDQRNENDGELGDVQTNNNIL